METKPSWNIEKRSLRDLKGHPKNPRRISRENADQLKNSLEKFGTIDKPCINTDNTVIGGHQRIAILKKLGYKEIEVYVPDRTLEDEEVDELCIRLNKNVGEWDFDMLANEWDVGGLIECGFTLEDLGVAEEIEGDPDKKKKIKTCPHCGGEL